MSSSGLMSPRCVRRAASHTLGGTLLLALALVGCAPSTSTVSSSATPSATTMPAPTATSKPSSISTVYVGSADGRVYALNAADGRRMWAFAAAGPIRSVTLVDGIVYAGDQEGQSGTLYALSAATGVALWHVSVDRPVYLPVVEANGVVFAGTVESSFYALRVSDGKTLWTWNSGGCSTGNVVVAGSVV